VLFLHTCSKNWLAQARVDKLGPDVGDAFAHVLLPGFGMTTDGPLPAWISALSRAGDPWHALRGQGA
jgi:hypothetical protein